MHCLSYLITFRNPQILGWSLILFSSTLVQPLIEWVTLVSYSKLKFSSVGGSVLYIYNEFLFIHRQRIVDGATNEWFPIISGVPQLSLLGSRLSILHTLEMFELVEKWLYAYADDATLLVVLRKPADRPAVAASRNRDLTKIQEWCSHWCMILNPNKIKVLVLNRSRAVNPPSGYLVLSGVSIGASPNLDILGATFDSKLTL